MKKKPKVILILIFILLAAMAGIGMHYRLGRGENAMPEVRFTASGMQYQGNGAQAQPLEGGSLLVSLGDASVLYAADGIRIPALPATVLAFHGGGLSEALLDAIHPDCAIILSPAQPEEETLHLLDRQCKRVCRQDLQGDIRIAFDGQQLIISAEKEASSKEIFPYRADFSLEAKEPPYSYILNRSSKVIHLPFCPSVEQMKEENKLFSTDSLEALTAQGYRPCGNCQPSA